MKVSPLFVKTLFLSQLVYDLLNDSVLMDICVTANNDEIHIMRKYQLGEYNQKRPSQ